MFLGFVLATTSMIGNATKSSTTVAILVPFVISGHSKIEALLTCLALRYPQPVDRSALECLPQVCGL